MVDYISREAFKRKYLCCGYLPEMSEDEFDKFPAADVVEVTRCKDCKYRRKNDENELYCIAEDGLSDPWDDEFCSYGKRKERTHEED